MKPTDPATRRALEASLVADLVDGLVAEERALGPVDFEELAAAAEGSLDGPAGALWGERVARDPALARRAAELAEFAREAWPQAAPAPRGAGGAWRWVAGIAAALLLALLVAGRAGERPHAASAPAPVVAATPPAPSEPSPTTLFADGFESGDASHWITSPSG